MSTGNPKFGIHSKNGQIRPLPEEMRSIIDKDLDFFYRIMNDFNPAGFSAQEIIDEFGTLSLSESVEETGKLRVVNTLLNRLCAAKLIVREKSPEGQVRYAVTETGQRFYDARGNERRFDDE